MDNRPRDIETASEWETIAADDDLGALIKPQGRAVRHIRNKTSIIRYPDKLSYQASVPLSVRRNTDVLPKTFVHKSIAEAAHRNRLTLDDSLRSLTHTHTPNTNNVDVRVFDPDGRPSNPALNAMKKRRAATLGFESSAVPLPSFSNTSSNVSTDPFEYDGAEYSMFLKEFAEKEVSQALYHVDSSTRAASTPGWSRFPVNQTSQISPAYEPGVFYNPTAIQST